MMFSTWGKRHSNFMLWLGLIACISVLFATDLFVYLGHMSSSLQGAKPPFLTRLLKLRGERANTTVDPDGITAGHFNVLESVAPSTTTHTALKADTPSVGLDANSSGMSPRVDASQIYENGVHTTGSLNVAAIVAQAPLGGEEDTVHFVSMDSRNFTSSQLRTRTFERLYRTDVPWEDKPVKSTVLGYPEHGADLCNPMSLSCACLERWYERRVCREVSHRQKERINLTFYQAAWWLPNKVDIGAHDCPSTRCHVSLGKVHKDEAHAFIAPLKPGKFLPSLFFPRKTNAALNKNVMLNFESSIKYKMLADPYFYTSYDISLYGSHTSYPVPTTLLSNGSLSFIELSDLDRPASSFRNYGPSFSERSDHVALFVSHCIGTRMRTKLLKEISKHIKVYSFGTCTPPQATKANVADIYPMCANVRSIGKMAEKECVLRYSKFSLSIENAQEHNYVTEKLYQALAMGAVPIYFGAPNIKELLPHAKAAILVSDFKDVASCFRHVKAVAADKAQWDMHREWKAQRFSDGFNRILQSQRGSMFCSICEHLADDNKARQTNHVTPLHGHVAHCAALALIQFGRIHGNTTMPLGNPYAWHGLDGVMALLPSASGGQERYNSSLAAIERTLGVTPWLVPGVDKLSDTHVACLANQVLAARTMQTEGLQDKEAAKSAAYVMAAMYMLVKEGRQNVLVVGARLDEGEETRAWQGLEGGHSASSDASHVFMPQELHNVWPGVLTRLPRDFHVLLLPRHWGRAVEVENPADVMPDTKWVVVKANQKPDVRGEWVVSNEGARKIMRGDTDVAVYALRRAAPGEDVGIQEQEVQEVEEEMMSGTTTRR